MIRVGSIIRIQYQHLAIVFVDNTNFYMSGMKFQQNMQEILDTYAKLYQVMGGRIQQEKIWSYYWQWEWRNNKKVIRDLELEVKIGGVEIK